MDVEQVGEPVAYHGEGPLWDATRDRLLMVDMLAGDLLAVDVRTGAYERTPSGSAVLACVRPRRAGGYVLGLERGFALLAPGASTPEPYPDLWDDAGVRMNEGGCDPQGRFYCGSMAYDGTRDRGRLWRLDPDGRTSVVLDPVSTSNGLGWSPDGATAYYVDSPTRRVDAFDADPGTGELTGRRPLVRVPDDVTGNPDGLTVDAEGCLWVAFYRGGCVRRYRPDGTLDGEVTFPASRTTACTFGGPDLGELYVTTSREKLPADAELGEAGAVYRVTGTGVRGLPPLAFAG